jgi:hypothetical protein
VIVLRGVFEGLAQVSDGSIGITGVERDCGGIDSFVRRPRAGRSIGRFSFADTEIEPCPLEELSLVGIALDDRSELLGGGAKIVSLQGSNAGFVQSDGLIVGGLLRRNRRGAGRLRDVGRSGRGCGGASRPVDDPRGASLFPGRPGFGRPALFGHVLLPGLAGGHRQ